MNFPWRRQPLPTGQELIKEARQRGVSLEGLLSDRIPLDSINDRRHEPAIQSRLLAARAEQRNAVLSVAQTLGIIFTLLLTLGLAFWNGHRESKRESGDMMIKFNGMLNSGESGVIARTFDMEGNLDHTKLTPEALDDAIDDFLSDYELLDAAYRSDLIDEDMAYTAFSYELEKALNDARVRHYLAASRREEADLFDGVLELARDWKLKFPAITPAAQAKPTANIAPTPIH